jgi:hypothetical protein
MMDSKQVADKLKMPIRQLMLLVDQRIVRPMAVAGRGNPLFWSPDDIRRADYAWRMKSIGVAPRFIRKHIGSAVTGSVVSDDITIEFP